MLRDKFQWPAFDLERTLALLRGWTTPVQPEVTVTAVQRDEADNRVLECALAYQAEYIVASDRDLRDLGEFQEIRTVTAVQFLSVIGIV